jgi:hypothetical protein
VVLREFSGEVHHHALLNQQLDRVHFSR